MLNVKRLNKITKTHGVEKMMIEAASKGEFDIEIDNNLLNSDIREKLTKKGFTLYYGNITTCISWRYI